MLECEAEGWRDMPKAFVGGAERAAQEFLLGINFKFVMGVLVAFIELEKLDELTLEVAAVYSCPMSQL